MLLGRRSSMLSDVLTGDIRDRPSYNYPTSDIASMQQACPRRLTKPTCGENVRVSLDIHSFNHTVQSFDKRQDSCVHFWQSSPRFSSRTLVVHWNLARRCSAGGSKEWLRTASLDYCHRMDAIVYECVGLEAWIESRPQQWSPRRRQHLSIALAVKPVFPKTNERYKNIRTTVWKSRTERTSLPSSSTSTATNEMRSSVVSACLAISFVSAVQAADVKTWKLAFWSGSHCTSAEVAVDQGPAYPSLSQVCNPIPELGLTRTFDYEVASGDYSYILGLHKTDDCSDAGGVFQGLLATHPVLISF
jgi:hypothetical protein